MSNFRSFYYRYKLNFLEGKKVFKHVEGLDGWGDRNLKKAFPFN